MGKKRKLTSAERKARKLRKAQYTIVFVNGKQKRVRRPPTIDGLPADEFLRRNADPVWLMQNGYYELLERHPDPNDRRRTPARLNGICPFEIGSFARNEDAPPSSSPSRSMPGRLPPAERTILPPFHLGQV